MPGGFKAQSSRPLATMPQQASCLSRRHATSPSPQVLPSFMLEEITFGAAQRVKLVQRIMTALSKCVHSRT